MSKAAPPPPGFQSKSRSGGRGASAPAPTGDITSRIQVGKPEKPAGEKLVIYGEPGLGKTTTAAHAPKPVFLLPPDDPGLKKLISRGMVPEDVGYVEVSSWEDALEMLRHLAASSDFEAVVIDNLAGFETLCQAHVCATKFKGNWSESGYEGFGRGARAAAREWSHLMQELDAVSATGKHVVLLAHCKIHGFNNPLGPDFDEFRTDLEEKTWNRTHKWADGIFFLTRESVIDEDGKGAGGGARLFYTEIRDGVIAKNRYNMPSPIYLDDDPRANWSALWEYIEGAE